MIGHGTLMFEFGGKTIHVDPWSQVGDYSNLPKADIVMVTHHHGDHLDVAALNQVVKDDTIVCHDHKMCRANRRHAMVTNFDGQWG